MHRKLALSVACSASAVIAVLGVTAGASQAARQTGSPRLTWAEIAKMTPVQVAALQHPLLATADPLQAVGSTAMRNIFWGAALDTPGHAVDIYVTDPGKAASLIAMAKKRDPRLDASLIRVRRAAYSAASLTAAGGRLIAASIAKRLPFALNGVGQLDRGASLRLMVDSAAQARKLSGVPLASLGGRSVAQLAGVRLTFEQTRPVPLTRENDTLPFIGGDYLTANGEACTAGISIENSSGRDFLITANHCFKSGSTVHTENGTTAVGIPYRYNANEDAELIDTGKYNGAGANADEGESDTSNGGIKWYPLPANAAPLVNGQQVCQDGVSSYMFRNAVPCNMEVAGTIVPEVCGQNGPCEYITEIATASTDGNPVVIQGDSGAVVFTVASATTRDAAGMENIGYGPSNPVSSTNSALEYYHLGFVWWANLYNAFGFTGHLNPHT